MFAVFPFLLAALSAFSAGCGSDKLVDQGSAQTEEIIRSVQNNFADDGWTYMGYEVLEKDKENDTAVFLISCDAEGDARDLLEKNISKQPVNDSIYDLAEDINVKITVELSAYDKDGGVLASMGFDTSKMPGPIL